jgi:hypothetical protein
VLSDSSTVATVALGLAAFALVVTVVLAFQVGRLRRGYDGLVGGSGADGFADAFAAHAAERDAVRGELAAVRSDLAAARSDLASALRHVAVVRFDAFHDMGGRLSFSAALLDDAGDGVVLTSINGRSETRTYAKSVVRGGSEHALSPEEQEAIAHATRPGGLVEREPATSGRRSRPLLSKRRA